MGIREITGRMNEQWDCVDLFPWYLSIRFQLPPILAQTGLRGHKAEFGAFTMYGPKSSSGGIISLFVMFSPTGVFFFSCPPYCTIHYSELYSSKHKAYNNARDT